MLATYEYLRGTKPFNRWKLPHGSGIKFGLLRLPETCGDYLYLRGQHRIRISPLKIGNTLYLIETMAHEMTHLRQQMLVGRSNHGALFKRLAAQVCKHHGLDEKAF